MTRPGQPSFFADEPETRKLTAEEKPPPRPAAILHGHELVADRPAEVLKRVALHTEEREREKPESSRAATRPDALAQPPRQQDSAHALDAQRPTRSSDFSGAPDACSPSFSCVLTASAEP
jgi:hypothetical protein